ncbi:MAG: hypothetical protein HZA66_15700 [Rhodopseudomonas palustris]|uniref:Alpha/beta hydrolase n=1 Tax=Rhodopseudomonas palustris TaxID=1076 RepID=A0A933RY82_RHOPL|nr:hypothetical protein [Rhodopseudomonas palustris]
MLGGSAEAPELPGFPEAGIARYLKSFDPPGAVVAIPWRHDADLDGYYLPCSDAGTQPTPVIVGIGETYGKGALLTALARPARDRRLALLCVDLGSAGDTSVQRCAIRPESCVSAVVDYLVEQPEIDPARIAVIADGSPSSLVARGVAMDGRVAAAVCDGGLWEQWEHAQTTRLSSGLHAIAPRPIAASIRCPTLIPLRPDSGIDPAYARQLLANGRSDRRNNISVADYAATDAGTVAASILDWVDRQLNRSPRRGPVAVI